MTSHSTISNQHARNAHILPVSAYVDDSSPPPALSFVGGFVTAIRRFINMLVSAFMGLLQGHEPGLATRESNPITQVELLQIQRPQQPSNNLTMLPVEILTEVMTHLEWRDVLRVREVCKVLQETSMTRRIWENLLRELVSRSQIRTKLECPIELYSSKELERLALQWTTANIGWTSGEPLRFRQHKMSDDDVLNFQLVEGGRWLLVVNQAGRVSYYDVDEEEITEKTLIPEQLGPQLEPLDETSTLMDVDMDVDARFLAFNLGLCFRRTDVSLLQVWRVRLEVDSHGRGTGLKAEILASFPRDHRLLVYSFSMLGEYVAFSVARGGGSHLYIVVIDWAQAHSHCERREDAKLLYPTQLIYPVNNPGRIRLLPGRRLIMIYRHCVRLYDLSAQANRRNLSLHHMHALYEWYAHVGDLHLRSLSKSFHHTESGTIRLIARSWNTIYGIIIPSIEADARDPENSLQVVTLMNYEAGVGDFYPSLGYNHAMVFRPFYVVSLNYSWPDDPEFKPPTTSIRHSTYRVRSMNDCGMDERSGREVFSNGKEIIVFIRKTTHSL
ncbi:hypothetical protein BDZ97DRAFT_2057907 [Flammula alnicola]|nr:hypothetical protein BDZ97DRAFT_2057907 [Flammula alnicola]